MQKYKQVKQFHIFNLLGTTQPKLASPKCKRSAKNCVLAGPHYKSGSAAWQGIARKQVNPKKREIPFPHWHWLAHVKKEKSYSHASKISQSCSTSFQPSQKSFNEFHSLFCRLTVVKLHSKIKSFSSFEMIR